MDRPVVMVEYPLCPSDGHIQWQGQSHILQEDRVEVMLVHVGSPMRRRCLKPGRGTGAESPPSAFAA
jgi:hypothetical protein